MRVLLALLDVNQHIFPPSHINFFMHLIKREIMTLSPPTTPWHATAPMLCIFLLNVPEVEWGHSYSAKSFDCLGVWALLLTFWYTKAQINIEGQSTSRRVAEWTIEDSDGNAKCQEFERSLRGWDTYQKNYVCKKTTLLLVLGMYVLSAWKDKTRVNSANKGCNKQQSKAQKNN